MSQLIMLPAVWVPHIQESNTWNQPVFRDSHRAIQQIIPPGAIQQTIPAGESPGNFSNHFIDIHEASKLLNIQSFTISMEYQ